MDPTHVYGEAQFPAASSRSASGRGSAGLKSAGCNGTPLCKRMCSMTGMTRREAVSMVGAGVAASTAGYVRAESSSEVNQRGAPRMDDPREKYPKPPFKSQE